MGEDVIRVVEGYIDAVRKNDLAPHRFILT